MEHLAGQPEWHSIKRLNSAAGDTTFKLQLDGEETDHDHIPSMMSRCICSRLFS
jgi:hypothetical protein